MAKITIPICFGGKEGSVRDVICVTGMVMKATSFGEFPHPKGGGPSHGSAPPLFGALADPLLYLHHKTEGLRAGT